MFLITILLLFYFASIQNVASQNFKIVGYDTENGLPSMQIHSIVEDKQGYLWMNTTSGLARFNGKTFENYTVYDGLPENEVFFLNFDIHNNLWFITLSNKLYTWKYANSYWPNFLPKNDSIRFLQVIGDKIFVDRNKTILIFENQKLKQTIRYDTIKPSLHIVSVLEEKQETYWFTTDANVVLNFENRKISKIIFDKKQEIHYFIKKFFAFDAETYLFNNKNKIFSLNTKSKEIKEILCIEDDEQLKIICYLLDWQKNLWIGTNKGVFYYERLPQNVYLLKDKFLENIMITDMLQDKEKQIWFSTQGNGLFCIPNYLIKNILNHNYSADNNIQKLYKNNNVLYAGSFSGKLYAIQKNIQTIDCYAKSETLNRILDIAIDKNQNIWIAKDNGLCKIRGNKKKFYGKFNSLKSIAISRENNILIGWRNGVLLTDNNYNIIKNYQIGRTNIVAYHNNKIYVSGNYGLGYIEDDSLYVMYNFDFFNSRIADFNIISDTLFLVATNGNGVFIIENKKITHLTTKNGLLSNNCSAIEIDKNKNLWIGTNKGINVIDRNLRISTFSQNCCLSSTEINDILSSNDTIYVATTRGMSYFDVNNYSYNTFKPNISKFEILVNNEITQNYHTLKYKQNNITIKFESATLKSNGKEKYEVVLIKNQKDTNIIITENREIKFNNLSFGDYQILLRCISSDQIIGDYFMTYFKIIKPLWLRNWFIVLILLLLHIFLFFLVFQIIKKIKKKEKLQFEIQQQIAKLEHIAFRNQINPHFIFNTINSIQYLIVKSDTSNAIKYLNSFGHLLRKILSISDKSEILLEEEIELLQMYLELESFRFANKFEYLIEDKTVQNYNIYLPPMLIQPFVENAIKHGLLPKQNDQKLLIEFTTNDEYLICKIEDNGIGIENSLKSKKTNNSYKSKAIELINKRIENLNKNSKKKYSLEISQITNADGTSAGTRVELKIPLKK